MFTYLKYLRCSASLKSGDPKKREDAVAKLRELTYPKVPDLLLTALEDEDKGVRERALIVIDSLRDRFGDRFGDPEFLAHMIPALSDPDPDVRRRAVEAIANVGGSLAVKPLAKMIRSETDAEVKSSAMDELSRIGGTEAGNAIAIVLEDPRAELRYWCAAHLEQMGWKPQTARQAAWFAVESAPHTGDWQFQFPRGDVECMRALLTYLAARDAEQMGKALNSDMVVRMDASTRHHMDHGAHRLAAHKLAEIGDSRAMPHLLKILQQGYSGRLKGRMEAVCHAIGELGALGDTPALIQQIDKEDEEEMRHELAVAIRKIMGRHGSLKDIPGLIEQIGKDRGDAVRTELADAIPEIIERHREDPAAKAVFKDLAEEMAQLAYGDETPDSLRRVAALTLRDLRKSER